MAIFGLRSPHLLRFSLFRFCMTAVAALLLAGSAGSQTAVDQVHVAPLKQTAARNGEPESGTAPTLHARLKPVRVDVELVLVPVTVTDALNRPLTGLEKKDFLLYEDDRQQHIRYFAQEDAPLSLGVILDLSKSMKNKIEMAREAVGEFFNNAHPEDDYFVIGFSDRPAVLADSTQSVGTIRAKLASATPNGHTALLDAIYMGIAKARSARYKRRALLIISDGEDNHSRYRAREIKVLVQEADIEIYAIGIFDGFLKTPQEWAGKRLLTEITEATGGRTVSLRNSAQLPEVAAAISWELRNRYMLGYRSSNPVRDGKWRKIQVRVSAQSGAAPLQVHFRRGYQAPGD